MQYNIPSEFRLLAGIYIIKNSVNCRVYIGSAVSFQRRYGTHRWQLKNNTHHSVLLQRFVNKYGLDTLSFNLITTCCKEDLIKLEQMYINEYKSFSPNHGFNINNKAGSCLGLKHSEETKLKISKAGKGKNIGQKKNTCMQI